MLKQLIIITGFLFSYKAYSKENCDLHPIYCKIVKFKKPQDKSWAMEFSNKLVTKAKKAGVDPNVALAILLQESMLENVNTFKTDKNVEKSCDDSGCYKVTTIKQKAFDISIAQINVNTALHYNLDVERLFMLDQDYALDSFFIILKDKMRQCSHLGQESYSCYHSFTEKYRKIYVDLVGRYL